MSDIPTNPSPDKLAAIFRALCEARAYMYAAGERSLIEAVDSCQAWAVERGLVSSIGQDAVQAIMADAFLPHRGDLP